MKKYEVLKKIKEDKIVAVIRAESVNEAYDIVSACINGGINIIELTFTVDYAHEIIKALKEKYQENVLIGAGTVLDSETARLAILNKADFIVSPSFNLECAKLCNRYQVPYMPGCFSIREIVEAMEAGCDIIKIFPASALGPSYIKAIKGPLPNVNLMPTGGVSVANAKDWLDKGCVCIGVGGELYAPARNKDFEKITEIAKLFVRAIK